MNYLLDTNHVIALLRNNPPGVRVRLRLVVSRGAAVAVSSIVLYELWYGVARSASRPRTPSGCASSFRAILPSFLSPKKTPWLPAICALHWKGQEPRSAPMTY